MPLLTEIKLTGALGAGVIAAYAAFFVFSGNGVNPWLWLLLAGGIWSYCVWQVWRRIELNRPQPSAPCFDDFGWANRLTLLRGGLIALAGGFLGQSPGGNAVWIPGLLYGLAAALDGVDGTVARRTGTVSLLGKALDTEMDALGLLVAPLLAVFFGKFHWSFLAVGAAYYLFTAGVRWRRHRNLPIHPLPPSVLRRILAGFQMGFVALALLPAFSSPVTRLLGVVLMVPILVGFFLDWLAVSACVPKPEHIRRRLARLVHNALPILRATVCLLVFLRPAAVGFPADFPSITFALLAVLTLLGLGARTSAGFLLMGWSQALGNHPVAWQDAAVLVATSGVLLFGAGNLSLWRGDDLWLQRR